MTNKPESKPLSSTSLPERVVVDPNAAVDDRSTLEPDPPPVVGPNEEVTDPYPSPHPSAGHDLGLLEAGQAGEGEIPARGYTGGSIVGGIDLRSDEERRVNRTGVTIEETKEAEQRAEEDGNKREQAAKERDAERAKAAKAADKK